MSFIKLENVSFSYRDKSKPAIKQVSLSFAKMEKVAITGLNGSGKSTLVKIMVRLLKPQAGQVKIAGKAINELTLADIGKRLGYVFQHPTQMFFNTTVFEEVAFGLRWKGMPDQQVMDQTRNLLEGFNLWQLRNASPYSLSAGQRQLLAISSILALKPDYLILDEPTKYIDAQFKVVLKEALNNIWLKGTGIIVVTHDDSLVTDLAHRIILVVNGEVVEDKTAVGC